MPGRVLLVAPILIPLLAAVACMLAWERPRIQRAISGVSAFLLLAASLALFGAVYRGGILTTQMGGWPAPFGITLVADHLAAIMVVAAGLVAVAGTFYALDAVDRRRQSLGFHPLLQFLMAGTCGAFLTGDIFNLYVWIELMLLSSFVLLALGGERTQLEGAIKYVVLNMVASFLLLAAVGLLYGTAGTLNMADLAIRLEGMDRPGLMAALAMLFLVSLGIKGAVFPLFFWLPASYHTPPVAITAIFSGLLTKVGVYALIRIFTLLFTQDVGYTHTIILVAGGLTMVTGVLGAVAQTEMRRLLAFHIISQMGYMLMGLGLLSAYALGAMVFFTVHIIVTKMALFLVAGVARRLLGTFDLSALGGLWKHRPFLAACFLVPALSLGGIPPLSGFVGKVLLVQAGLELRQYAIVAIALAVSLLTLYSMTKIFTYAFWKPLPSGGFPERTPGVARLMGPIVLLAIVTIAMGVWAGPLFGVAMRAGEELANPAGYIRAVLGELP